MKNQTIKLFILHATFLEHRKTLCSTLIEKLKKMKNVRVDVEYVTDYDPDKISVDEIKKLVSLSKSPDNSDFYDQFVKNMHVKQLSNACKHLTALQKASKQQTSYDYFMILEDDVIFGDDIIDKFTELVQQVQSSSFDILFTGLPSLTPIVNNKLMLQDVHQMFKILPCCDSYIIKSENVNKIVESFVPIRFVTNIHLSYLIDKSKLDAKMCIPNVFLDGSKFGVYISSLEANNKLFLNPDYNKAVQLLRQPENKDAMESLSKLFSNIRFKNHPDMIYLLAQFEMNNKNYEKAKELFENAYAIYKQNGCVLNNESEFLQSYISVFKHFQSM